MSQPQLPAHHHGLEDAPAVPAHQAPGCKPKTGLLFRCWILALCGREQCSRRFGCTLCLFLKWQS
jgi:hypothetical protein